MLDTYQDNQFLSIMRPRRPIAQTVTLHAPLSRVGPLNPRASPAAGLKEAAVTVVALGAESLSSTNLI
jgi:hypothetical protein